MTRKKGPVTNRSIQRPFVCDFPGCDRCFTRFDHLQRHALVHDDAAPQLPCPQCGKTFLRHDMLVRHQRSVHEQKKGKKPRSNSNEDGASSSKRPKPCITLPAAGPSGQPSSDPSTPALFMQPFLAPPGSDYGAAAFGGYSSWRQGTQPSSEEVSPTSEKSWSSSMLGSGISIASNLYWANGQPTAVPVLPSSSTAMQSYAQATNNALYNPNGTWHNSAHDPTHSGSAAFTSSASVEALGGLIGPLPSRSSDSITVQTAHNIRSLGHQQDRVDFPSLSSSACSSAFVSGPNYLDNMMVAFPSLMASQANTFGTVAAGSSDAFTAGTPTVPSQMMKRTTSQSWWMPTSEVSGGESAAYNYMLQMPTNRSSTGSSAPPNPSTAPVPMLSEQECPAMLTQTYQALAHPVTHEFGPAVETDLTLSSSSNKSSSDSTLTGQPEVPIMGEHVSDGQSLSNVDVQTNNGQKTQAAQKLCTTSSAWVESLKSHTEVTEITRLRLLEFLATASDLPCSPYLSCSHLSKLLDLFFDNWNSAFPMLHRPSFRTAEVCPALLAACIVMGTYFADLTHVSELGRTMAAKLWPAIVGLDNFDPQSITLEVMQAMVLLDAYGTFCASRRLHEMADCFHHLIIAFARRNALFDSGPGPDRRQSTHADPNLAWAQWIAHEEKIRLAHAIYMLDVLGSMLFRHQASLAAVLPNLVLPAELAEWEQPSATAWLAFRAEGSGLDLNADSVVQATNAVPTTQRTFESALKQCLTGVASSGRLETHPHSVVQDSLAHTLLIIGLIGLSQDLIRSPGHFWTLRDHRNQEMPRKQLEILSAIKSCGANTLEGAVREDTQSPLPSIAATLKAAAELTMHADIYSIQVVCGVNPILGQYVGAQTLASCNASITSWAATPASKTATLVALHALCDLLPDDEASANTTLDVPDPTIFNGWIIYLSCIVLFTFSSCQSALGPSTALDDANEEGDEGSDRSTVSRFLATTKTWTDTSMDAAAVQKHLKDILARAVGVLSCSRWELPRTASATLRRLMEQLEGPPQGPLS